MKTKTALAVTLPLILAPIIYGLAKYSQLPAMMATHWGTNNEVNGYMPRAMMVVGIPILMAIFQLIVVLVPRRKQRAERFERMVIWIMPVITIVLYIVTIQFNLGHALDIRRIAVALIGAMFIAMGNYLPTVPADYRSVNWGMQRMLSQANAKMLLRRLGFVMAGSGVLLLVSLLLPATWSWVAVGIAIIAVLIASFAPLAKRA